MNISIRARAGLMVGVIIGLSGGLILYLVHTGFVRALESSAGSSLSAAGAGTLDKLDRFLYERQSDLQGFAEDRQLEAFLALSPTARTPAAAAEPAGRLRDYKQITNGWTGLAVLDSRGEPVLPDSGPADPAAELTGQDQAARLLAAAAAGRAGYSDVLPAAPGKAPAMLFVQPVRNMDAAGQPVVGVLAGTIDWKAALDALDGPKTTKMWLVNSSGLLLGGSGDIAGSHDVLTRSFAASAVFRAAQRHGSGSGIFAGLQNTDRQFLTAYVSEHGYQAYHGNHWALVLQTPAAAALAPAQQLTKRLLVAYAGVLAASVLIVALMMQRQVVRPAMRLKDAALRLAKGDFSREAQVKPRNELGQLGTAFNSMIDSLLAARQELARRGRQAGSEERLMRALLQNLPVGAMALNAATREPVMMNRMAERLTGRKPDAPQGSAYREGYPITRADGTPYPPSESAAALAARYKKTVVKDDIMLARPDGGTRMLREVAAPIEVVDGQVKRVAVLLEDITQQRELERSRDEFFSIASHELRTPLTAIRGNSEMIQLMYPRQLEDPELKSMVMDIHESASRLIDIVNDFLDTSRLEQKRMTFDLEAIDLIANAEAVIKEYQVTGSRQKNRLEVIVPDQPLPKVWADPNRVKQVIINLVGNALKFTEHGSVTISFAVEPRHVKVLVTDTGRGMTPAARKLLFKKFGRTGSHTITHDSARSSGLGLYIAKMIIEQLHGSIRLESSAVGVGTCFSFTLPVAPGQPPAAGK